MPARTLATCGSRERLSMVSLWEGGGVGYLTVIGMIMDSGYQQDRPWMALDYPMESSLGTPSDERPVIL